MAKDLFYSSQVCKELACDLVTEQAELLKHESLVEQIKTKLVEGKQQLIEHLILGKELYYKGKKRTALHVNFYLEGDKMEVVVTMGIAPDGLVPRNRLTKKERMLVDDYKDLLYCCKNRSYENCFRDTLKVADELRSLKNGICLTNEPCWVIDFGNATTPGFFEQTRLEVYGADGHYMLEDLILNNH